MDNLSFDIEWLLKHVAVIVNDILLGKRVNWQKHRPMVDFRAIFGRGSTMIRSTWSISEINSSLHLWYMIFGVCLLFFGYALLVFALLSGLSRSGDNCYK